ncbi:hypothetical protein IKQ21_06465 [bacterium]|nr:hypothetical protein [bacterium]
MTYYAHFNSRGVLTGISKNQLVKDEYDSSEVANTEVTEELYEDYILTPNKYIAGEKEIEIEIIDEETGQSEVTIKTIPYPVLNPNYDTEEAEKERVRIANFHLTRGDVFRGLLLAKGITRAEIREIIEAMSEETPEERLAKEMALIDFDEALEFYRGVALIDTIGATLGITPEQMDKFFDTKDWKYLTETKGE